MGRMYDVADGDVYFSTSGIGWVVGHSYIVYAPLLKVPTVCSRTPDHRTQASGQTWSRNAALPIFSPTMRGSEKFRELVQGKDLSSLKYVFLR
jgi:propionyl-CoA synthetase